MPRFMETAAQRLPEDDTLAIMAADARMVASDEHAAGLAGQRLLERVLARNPDHGGAIHFYIHLTDWIDRQHLAEPYADRLGRIAPAASHLVHMPSHTFYGVGRYQDAAAVNVAAIAADRAYVDAGAAAAHPTIAPACSRHNMHFAIESALARGDGATALDVSPASIAPTYLTGEVDSRVARCSAPRPIMPPGLHDADRRGAGACPSRSMRSTRRCAIMRAARRWRGAATPRRCAPKAAAIAALRDGTDVAGARPRRRRCSPRSSSMCSKAARRCSPDEHDARRARLSARR